MDIVEYIKLCCVKKKINLTELARLSGQSPQSLHNKLVRGMPRIDQIEEIAKAMNCELVITFVDKDTNEPLI